MDPILQFSLLFMYELVKTSKKKGNRTILRFINSSIYWAAIDDAV